MSDALPQTIYYEHTQRAWLTALGFVFGLVTQTAAFIRDLRARRRRAWLYFPLILVNAASMYMFSALTVTVRDGEVTAAFAGGLVRRMVDLAGVASAEVVTLPWYYGWGARVTPQGWLYSVWGREAVRLHFADGGAFTIGSPEPYLLLNAIEQARRRTAA